MERSVRLRLDGPQALYIGDCLKREEQAAQLSAGKPSLAAYWQQLLVQRLTREGLMLWVPLHIAPCGVREFMVLQKCGEA